MSKVNSSFLPQVIILTSELKLERKSGLDLDAYTFLFHPENTERSLTISWKPTFCFRLKLGGGNDVWTLYRSPAQDLKKFSPILGGDRSKRLLSFATQHSNVQTVGPLDFCGTARLVSNSRGDK